jgi:hypothetical protein
MAQAASYFMFLYSSADRPECYTHKNAILPVIAMCLVGIETFCEGREQLTDVKQEMMRK